jgi:hypothetical protein
MLQAAKRSACAIAVALTLATPGRAQVAINSLDGAEFTHSIILDDGSVMGGSRFRISGQKGTFTSWGYQGRDKETRKCTFVGLTCVLKRTAVLTELVEIRSDGGQAFYRFTFQFEPQGNSETVMRRVR